MSALTSAKWDQGYGLTWSGKWHFITKRYEGKNFARARCGAIPYAEHQHVPNHVGRLQRISKGYQDAPICRRCSGSYV